MLSRLVITFLPRSKSLLISWLQSPSAVILEPKKIKSVTVSIVSPTVCHEVMGPDTTVFTFGMLSFKPAFHSPLHFHQETPQFVFTFCYKGGIICISEVIDMSPSDVAMPTASCLKTVPKTPEGCNSRLKKSGMEYFFLPLSANGSSQKQMKDPGIIFLVLFPIISLSTKFIPAFQLIEPSLLS